MERELLPSEPAAQATFARSPQRTRSKLLDLQASSVLRLADEQARARLKEQTWEHTKAKLDQQVRDREEQRQHARVKRTSEAYERALHKEQLERQAAAEEQRLALERVHEQQRLAAAAHARALHEANQRKVDAAERREREALKLQEQKDAQWDYRERKLRQQRLEQEAAAERVRTLRLAKIDAVAGASAREAIVRRANVARGRRARVANLSARAKDVEERAERAVARLTEVSEAREHERSERIRQRQRQREAAHERVSDAVGETQRQREARLELTQSLSEGQIIAAQDELLRSRSERHDLRQGKISAALAAREHLDAGRAERGAGRRAAQEAAAAAFLEAKQRRADATAARVAAEGRARRAIKAVEHEVLVHGTLRRGAVRARLLEQLEATRSLDAGKVVHVDIRTDAGARFEGDVQQPWAERRALPEHCEAARAHRIASLTAEAAAAASVVEKQARAHALLTKTLSSWSRGDVDTTHYLGGLSLGRRMFYAEGESKHEERDTRHIVDFEFDESKGRWHKVRRAARVAGVGVGDAPPGDGSADQPPAPRPLTPGWRGEDGDDGGAGGGQ